MGASYSADSSPGAAESRSRAACYALRHSVSSDPNLTGYLSVAVFLALILAFAFVSLAGAWAVRPSRPSASKSENYECGAQPIGEAWVQFPVAFYLVALIFLVFDTLAVFLFPWALTIRALGVGGLKTMLAFVAILSLAWVYAYREGILEWK
jgi:NADH:ubiquinone oxidoreductase subunit 3 (subunit A)